MNRSLTNLVSNCLQTEMIPVIYSVFFVCFTFDVEKQPTREDVAVAAQLVCDYLSEAVSKRLVEEWLALDMTAVFPTTKTFKRKADWELEAEVGISLIAHDSCECSMCADGSRRD
jgi:hypothetical protein